MENKLSSFAQDFPLGEPGAEYCLEIETGPYINSLFEILGIANRFIHTDVEMQYGDNLDVPTDIQIDSPLTYHYYVAESRGAPPFIVGMSESSMCPISGGSVSHGTYEYMRVLHEVSDPDCTVLLTPFEILVYSGAGSLFWGETHAPIDVFPLHEERFADKYGTELMNILHPPDHFHYGNEEGR